MKKIFVASLSWDVDDFSLQEAFEKFGEVISAKVVLDRESGRSRGFGFVEMEDEAAADAAIEALDGTELEGRTIVVKEAEDRRGGGNNRRGGNRW